MHAIRSVTRECSANVYVLCKPQTMKLLNSSTVNTILLFLYCIWLTDRSTYTVSFLLVRAERDNLLTHAVFPGLQNSCIISSLLSDAHYKASAASFMHVCECVVAIVRLHCTGDIIHDFFQVTYPATRAGYLQLYTRQTFYARIWFIICIYEWNKILWLTNTGADAKAVDVNKLPIKQSNCVAGTDQLWEIDTGCVQNNYPWDFRVFSASAGNRNAELCEACLYKNLLFTEDL